MFENRVLRRIFGPERDGVTGEWRKLHNEELNDLYSSPNIVRVIKSRRMRWAGHVAHMEEGRGVHKVSVRKPERKRPWEDQDVDGRIILSWILRKWEGVVGLDGVGSGYGQVAGACEYGNERSGSIKCGEFLDYLQNQLASQEGLFSME